MRITTDNVATAAISSRIDQIGAWIDSMAWSQMKKSGGCASPVRRKSRA